MKASLLLVMLLLGGSSLFSQSKFIRVKAGDDPAKAIPMNQRYRYPEFKFGSLFYSLEERSAPARMNYNTLTGQLMFIDKVGDTLVVSEEFAIKCVQIGKDFYYHDFPEGYYEILTTDVRVILASRRELKIARREMQGNNGYNKTDATGAVVSTKYSVRSPTTNIMNEDCVYKALEHLVLIDQNRHVCVANKSNITRIFRAYEDQVEAFIEKENINFRNRDDVRKLVNYCTEL